MSQSKKNKKKEKKTIPVATAVAVTPQATNKDAAQATTKDSKDTSSIRKAKVDQAKEVLPPAEVKPATSPKKKKGKSDSGDTGVAAQVGTVCFGRLSVVTKPGSASNLTRVHPYGKLIKLVNDTNSSRKIYFYMKLLEPLLIFTSLFHVAAAKNLPCSSEVRIVDW